jgi:hypothetical protein
MPHTTNAESVKLRVDWKYEGRVPHLRNAPYFEDPDSRCFYFPLGVLFWALFIAQLISCRFSQGFLTIRFKRTACPHSSIRALKKEVKNNSAEKNPTPALDKGGPAKSQESFSVIL